MYKEEKKSWMKHWDFILMDVVIFQIAFNIAYMIRHGEVWLYQNNDYARISVLLIFIDLCVAFFLESYGGILRRGYIIEFKETIKHISAVSGILIIYFFLWKESELFSRMTVLLMWGIGILLSYSGRIILKVYLQKRVDYQKTERAILVITTKEEALKSIENLCQYAYTGIRPVAIALVGDVPDDEVIEHIPVIGGEDVVIEYIKTHIVDEIYINVDDSAKLKNSIEKYILTGITVHVKLLEDEKMPGYKFVEEFAGKIVLTNTFKIATARQLLTKRIVDICGGVVGVFLTALLFLL